MNSLVEWLELPVGSTLAASGQVISGPCRIEMPPTFSIGPHGSDVVVPRATTRCSFVNRAPTLPQVDTDVFKVIRVPLDAIRVKLRFVEAANPEIRSPSALIDMVLAAAESNESSLSVLADALMEQEHPLGDRLRAPASTDDDWWLAHLAQPRREGLLDVTWRCGIVDSATVRQDLALLGNFAHHGAFSLMRTLHIVPTDGERGRIIEALKAMTPSTFHWLERVTVHGGGSAADHRYWQKTFLADQALRRALPRVRELSCEPNELEPRVIAEPDTRIRQWAGAPMLTVGQAVTTLTLNGWPRVRPSLGPWLIPVTAADRIELLKAPGGAGRR